MGVQEVEGVGSRSRLAHCLTVSACRINAFLALFDNANQSNSSGLIICFHFTEVMSYYMVIAVLYNYYDLYDGFL